MKQTPEDAPFTELTAREFAAIMMRTKSGTEWLDKMLMQSNMFQRIMLVDEANINSASLPERNEMTVVFFSELQDSES